MQGSKNMQAINGDRVAVAHAELDLSEGMTTHATVRHQGVNHAVVSTRAPGSHRLGMTTAQLTIAGFDARIVESVDTNFVGQSSVRYEAWLESPNGALWVQSYDSADHSIALLSDLDPRSTDLGVWIGPGNNVDFVTPAEIIVDADALGVLKITPLTEEVIGQLPDWQGTMTPAGELFAGHVSRSQPMLTLVTPTARVMVIPKADEDNPADMDELTRLASTLSVEWSAR